MNSGGFPSCDRIGHSVSEFAKQLHQTTDDNVSISRRRPSIRAGSLPLTQPAAAAVMGSKSSHQDTEEEETMERMVKRASLEHFPVDTTREGGFPRSCG